MTFKDVIPSEAEGRVEESMEWAEALGLLPIRLCRGERIGPHRSLRSGPTALGRDDKIGGAFAPSVGMTFKDVIPSEAEGRVEESMEWAEALGLLPIRFFRGERIGPHRSLRSGPMALGRDDKIGGAFAPSVGMTG